MNHPKLTALLSFLLLTFLAGGCANDNFGGSDPDGDGGGIDGSGIAEITAFGSVIFGDTLLETNATTEINIDDSPLDESDLAAGMIGAYRSLLGTALSIDVQSRAKGLVTGINPLEVLGQPVFVDGNVRLQDVTGNDITSITPGEEIIVYGFGAADDAIRATLIDRVDLSAGDQRLDSWQLIGEIGAVNMTQITVGNQMIETNGAVLNNCIGFSPGDTVRVVALPNNPIGFTTLNLVTQIDCNPLAFTDVPQLIQSGAEIELEGFISGFDDNVSETDFYIDGQLVRLTLDGPDRTFFIGGGSGSIDNGVEVEVEGIFIAGGVLLASEVEFEENPAEIKAIYDPATTALDEGQQTMELLGLTIQINALTKFDNVDVFNPAASVPPITAPVQLEVGGIFDSGVLTATEIKVEDANPDANTLVSAAVEGQTAMPVIGNSFSLLGLTILFDETTRLFIGEEEDGAPEFLGSSNSTKATEFFQLILDESTVINGQLTSSGIIEALGLVDTMTTPITIVADRIEWER